MISYTKLMIAFTDIYVITNFITIILLVLCSVLMCDFSVQMFPIIGDRYRCIDCKEKMGFDLCGDCYASRSKLPGRFNQQHTSEHKFKLVPPNIIHNMMLRLATAQLGEGSIDLESIANIEVTSDGAALFDDGEDNHNDSEATN